MTACDVCVTRQPNDVIMKHSAQKSTLFVPIIVPRQSETSSHSAQEGCDDVSRSMAAILLKTYGHVTRTSCDVPLCSGSAITKASCGNFREGFQAR